MEIRTDGAHVERWRETVVAAIEATRPAGEVWSATASEVVANVLQIDFARDVDVARSITLALPRSPASQTLLYRMSCYLLRTHWPGGLEVH
jgi:hypothetical protein